MKSIWIESTVWAWIGIGVGFVVCLLVENWRRKSERQHDKRHCSSCGYELTGIGDAVCPECGIAVSGMKESGNSVRSQCTKLLPVPYYTMPLTISLYFVLGALCFRVLGDVFAVLFTPVVFVAYMGTYFPLVMWCAAMLAIGVGTVWGVGKHGPATALNRVLISLSVVAIGLLASSAIIFLMHGGAALD